MYSSGMPKKWNLPVNALQILFRRITLPTSPNTVTQYSRRRLLCSRRLTNVNLPVSAHRTWSGLQHSNTIRTHRSARMNRQRPSSQQTALLLRLPKYTAPLDLLHIILPGRLLIQYPVRAEKDPTSTKRAHDKRSYVRTYDAHVHASHNHDKNPKPG